MAETREDRKTNAELVEDLKRRNAVLQAEVDMCERYTSWMEAESEMASQMETSGRKKTRAPTPGSRLLTMEQQCEVAQSVHKQISEDLKRLKSDTERSLDNYKATLEEADVHLSEVKKESGQFNRDIGKALRDKKSVTMNVEKVIRYIEDRKKAKDNLIEKLHQQNAALLAHKRKLQIQIKQQEKMVQGLTALDFEKLKIDNIKSQTQLDNQNHKHLELKLLAVNTLKALNSTKEKLQTLTQESDALSSDIASRRRLMVKMEEETKQAEEERSKAEALNRKLRGQLADFQVPHVLEYIKVEDSHSQLVKSVKAWERKVEIAEMALKTYTKAWDKLRISAGVGSSCP
nr:coiled-coil domain-containing protein 113 [Misgurnus anguillicaudatus]